MPAVRTVNIKEPKEVIVKEIPSREPREKRACFAVDPVSSVSRPVNKKESWALWEFESHARRCGLCQNPYEVYRSGELLCERGHRLAQDVSKYLANMDGATYSTVEEEQKLVRVELPEAYDEARGLLKAIERSLRHRRREPFVIVDRSLRVHSPERARSSIKVKVEQVEKPKHKPQRTLSGEIVDWPTDRPAPVVITERRTVVELAKSSNSRAKRGSLYESDIAQRQRDLPKYNVEIREPSKGSSGYHR